MPDVQRGAGPGLRDQLPTDRLAEQGRQLLGLLAERAVDRAVESVEVLADRLIDHASHGGPGLLAAITGATADADARPPLHTTVKSGVTGMSASVRQALSGVAGARRTGRSAPRAVRTMNIAEQIDVGVPVRLAYDQWTRFQDFSQFMKKVKSVEKKSAELSHWNVRFFWSHRDWESRIIEQVPDERIVWRSAGAKGCVDGTVSFHALAPNMTRVLLALEYHPGGLVERAGSLWRAHSRRVRLEIRQFRHHVMTQAVLDPDSVHGWRGEIRDSAVVRTHEEVLADETGNCDETGKRGETGKWDETDGAYDDSDDLYDDDSAREPARSRTR